MPLLGRNAVILKGATEIGYCNSVTVSIDVDLVKEYAIGGANPDKPAFLASGNKSFKVSIDKMYVDGAHATDVLNGTALTIEVRPEGTGTGKPKITVSNVILNSWELSIEQDGVIMESVEGEGASIAWGTQ
jgi:hypothetical protein